MVINSAETLTEIIDSIESLDILDDKALTPETLDDIEKIYLEKDSSISVSQASKDSVKM